MSRPAELFLSHPSLVSILSGSTILFSPSLQSCSSRWPIIKLDVAQRLASRDSWLEPSFCLTSGPPSSLSFALCFHFLAGSFLLKHTWRSKDG